LGATPLRNGARRAGAGLARAPGHPVGSTGSLPARFLCSSSCSFSSCVRQMWERVRLWQKDSRKESRGRSWARNRSICACGTASSPESHGTEEGAQMAEPPPASAPGPGRSSSVGVSPASPLTLPRRHQAWFGAGPGRSAGSISPGTPLCWGGTGLPTDLPPDTPTAGAVVFPTHKH